MVERITSWIDMPFFSRMYDSMKCCTVPGPSTLTDLPLRSLIELMLLRTASPSPPFDLSMSATCTEGIPADAQTMCWSTVVAAALSAPEASAAERCTGAMKRVSMSTPFFLKMPASSASFSGWNPVHPLMPSTTFSCAWAVNAAPAATMMASHFIARTPPYGGAILALALRHAGIPAVLPCGTCTARHRAQREKLAHGSAAAHAHEQP